MTRISLEQFMFGNRHWRSYRAVDEIEVYCDLLENLQDRIDSLETRGKDEEVTLRNVQAVISPNPPKGNRGGGQRRDEGPGIGLART